jgi:hypothetical protein
MVLLIVAIRQVVMTTVLIVKLVVKAAMFVLGQTSPPASSPKIRSGRTGEAAGYHRYPPP